MPDVKVVKRKPVPNWLEVRPRLYRRVKVKKEVLTVSECCEESK